MRRLDMDDMLGYSKLFIWLGYYGYVHSTKISQEETACFVVAGEIGLYCSILTAF
jgi:hypothetical protein